MISRSSLRINVVSFVVAGLLLAGFIGCIAIPLGDPEKAKVDDTLVGAWISKPAADGRQLLFTVVPYDARTCLVSEFEFTRKGDVVEPAGRFDWKMWMVDIKGTTFASMEMKNPQLALEPTADRYAAAKITRSGDTLTVQGVNDDFVKKANITTSKQLEDLIATNLNNADMVGEATALMKVTESEKDSIGKVLDAYANGTKK